MQSLQRIRVVGLQRQLRWIGCQLTNPSDSVLLLSLIQITLYHINWYLVDVSDLNSSLNEE